MVNAWLEANLPHLHSAVDADIHVLELLGIPLAQDKAQDKAALGIVLGMWHVSRETLLPVNQMMQRKGTIFALRASLVSAYAHSTGTAIRCCMHFSSPSSASDTSIVQVQRVRQFDLVIAAMEGCTLHMLVFTSLLILTTRAISKPSTCLSLHPYSTPASACHIARPQQ